MREISQLGEVLAEAFRYKAGLAMFLPMDQEWGEHTPAVVDDIDELEDPDRGVVSVGDHEYAYALGMDAVQSIVRNAQMQLSTATRQHLLEAFLFYYDNDAFIEFEVGQ